MGFVVAVVVLGPESGAGGEREDAAEEAGGETGRTGAKAVVEDEAEEEGGVEVLGLRGEQEILEGV